MSNFIFRCPITGLNVQHSDDDPEQATLLTVTCKACGGIHVVRRDNNAGPVNGNQPEPG